ncbi:transglycosylase SLT domain-containing protein [Paenibacillus solani]|uniref:aggregation-promoting factor C-terminal-like domain-containing protein n=1 Tax=Paenibacillus solani TaxID=1705565 RepID=UPI003D278C18
MSSPTTASNGVGAYKNYYKAERDAKANPKNYNTASTAVSKAIRDLGLPNSWLQPTLELIARESSFNPAAKNPKSSAAGLFQFLDMTRKDYGGSSVNWDDPYEQAVAGLKYIKNRYKDPVKALEHWDKKKWY